MKTNNIQVVKGTRSAVEVVSTKICQTARKAPKKRVLPGMGEYVLPQLQTWRQERRRHNIHTAIVRLFGIVDTAHKLGVSVSAVRDWLRKASVPNERHAQTLALLINVPIDLIREPKDERVDRERGLVE